MGALLQPPCAPTFPRGAFVSVVVAACLWTAGCRSLGLPSIGGVIGATDPPALARERPAATAPQTLPVELLFIRHDPADPAVLDDLWPRVDEQALDRGLAARLAANGLRAGILSGALPTPLAERLRSPQPLAGGEQDEAASRRVLRLLPGKRAEIVAAAGIAEVVLLEHDADGVRGGTYRAATAVVAVRAWPGADGRTRIELVPELKHGPLQRSWIGEEGAFRLETGQARRRFDQLAIEALLPHDGMLVIGAAGEPSATVGDALLRDRAGAAGMQLIVVRPLAKGVDPAFAGGGEDVVDDAP